MPKENPARPKDYLNIPGRDSHEIELALTHVSDDRCLNCQVELAEGDEISVAYIVRPDGCVVGCEFCRRCYVEGKIMPFVFASMGIPTTVISDALESKP